jgi:hypothetical protein
LKDIATSNRDPWLLAGDFNDILGANEKKGGAPICLRKCLKFKERIDACQLMDLGAIGSKFTWRGPTYHGGQRIFERLDRALSNDSRWLEFPDGLLEFCLDWISRIITLCSFVRWKFLTKQQINSSILKVL